MILVIDDEEALREVIQEVLEMSDVPCICAASGQEGLEIFTTNQDRIQAVLLDVQMPLMSGQETFEHLRQLNPNLPVVLMSGRPKHVTMAQFSKWEHLWYLEKPFTLDMLSTRIEEVLA